MTPDGAFRTTFGVGAAARTTAGGETRVEAPQPLGDDRGVGDANPVVEVAETEAWVAAWRARPGAGWACTSSARTASRS